MINYPQYKFRWMRINTMCGVYWRDPMQVCNAAQFVLFNAAELIHHAASANHQRLHLICPHERSNVITFLTVVCSRIVDSSFTRPSSVQSWFSSHDSTGVNLSAGQAPC